MSPNGALTVGTAILLEAYAEVTGDVSTDIAWTTADAALLHLDPTEGSSITITALAEGTTTVTATSTYDASVSDTVTLTILPADLGLSEQWTALQSGVGEEGSVSVATDIVGNVHIGFSSDQRGGDVYGLYDVRTRSYTPDGTWRWGWRTGTASDDFVRGIAVDRVGYGYTVGYSTGSMYGTNQGSADAFIATYGIDGTLRWGKLFGTSGFDGAYDVILDGDDNVYVVGYTTGMLGGNDSSGTGSLFVRSYSAVGTVRWTRQFGSSYDSIWGVTTDVNGNVYVAGITYVELESGSIGNLFLRSYSSEGDHRWTRQFGASADDAAMGLAADHLGNVFVVGYTAGSLDDLSLGSADVFVRSYTSQGDLRWGRQFGTPATDAATSVATDPSGNLYIVGETNGNLAGSNLGEFDVFVRSYSNGGILRGTMQFGSAGQDLGSALAISRRSGQVFVAGMLNGVEVEDPGGGRGTEFLYDMFVKAFMP